ncbi:peptide-methionine (S)-S-oxide reductase [Staphylococcus epidermidis]|jgi:peptide methionine sulfoxide reductase msrA 3|uniref:peptide-methionine (S)-S-oxide reductase n=1 Tax=Staphylococcus epidermidis TaxID=1282 RepID=UPI0002431A2F|nr:peptide-methionine (S)-S-oxide reductase [Staphylococcus epidermidis]MBA9875150.1 peptide-methionine (S)-S-oxide reductase [Ralstonia insidiosa]EHM70291.1 putative peptide-methionine (S)-S-oxide reductase [Staphylococcus epidermidis VCU071]KAB2192152.1 peptide-methionine (S)-S-oxide reductase [Staphylococcus epidermidis]MBC3169289.1 peptide-methionine (S)-S-oxide reductase [Staphylococcus epidermidis]MBE0333881.1 peptide-methionine (S)-S-oxide reductase [Staphylococcus epidermidis]
METVYFAGGCLWGTQAFFNTIPGVIQTEAGRANGTSKCLDAPYDGYAECVKIHFDPAKTSMHMLLDYLFEMINPYSLNQQGQDKGQKYRTGVYSESSKHLNEAKDYIKRREDAKQVMVEVQPLSNYVKSAEEHQNHLEKFPEDYYLCHVPPVLLNKYKK